MYRPFEPLQAGDWNFAVYTKYFHGHPVCFDLAKLMCVSTHLILKAPTGREAVCSIAGKGHQSNGAQWTLTGTPFAPTLHPSILMERDHGGWHGWLKAGQMVTC